MTDSETVLNHIVEIQTKDNCSLFDATLAYCEKNDIDVDDLMEVIDANIKERLKIDAINNHLVQKKYRLRTNKLFDD